MIFQVTYGFRGMGVGWSESHAVRATGVDQPSGIAVRCQQLAQKRVNFLGNPFEIHVTRISRYSNDAGTVRTKGSWLNKTIYKNPSTSANMSAEPAVVALIARGSTDVTKAPAAFTANQNRTFCGAPPDAAVDNGGIVFPAESNLGVNFDQWAAILVGQEFGWLVSATIAEAEIDVIGAQPDGTVEFATQAPVPNILEVGKIYKARCRRVNGGNSPLNGELILKYTSANTFVTQEVIGLGLAQAGGTLRIYAPISPFVGFANVVLEGQTGKHQRGRPFGSSPGRARKRIRG